MKHAYQNYRFKAVAPWDAGTPTLDIVISIDWTALARSMATRVTRNKGRASGIHGNIIRARKGAK